MSGVLVLGPLHFTDDDCAIPAVHALALNGRAMSAHRAIWELAHGEIPADVWVVRVCGNPRCVRLDHLAAMTRVERFAARPGRDRCARGHLLNEPNVWRSTRRPGTRSCRKCAALRARRRRARERGKA